MSLFVPQPDDGWAWVNTPSIQNLRSIINHRPQNFLHTTYHTRRIYYIPHSMHTVCPLYYIYAYTKNFLHTTYHTRRIYYIPHSIHTVCPPYYIYAYTKNFFIPHSIHAEFLTNHTIYTQNVFHSTAQNSPDHRLQNFMNSSSVKGGNRQQIQIQVKDLF